MVSNPTIYNPIEERWHVLTHVAGFLLTIVGTVILLNYAYGIENRAWLVASSIFMASMGLVYLSSTLYHYVKRPELKVKLRVLDHVSIFFLIAGTNTPLVLKYLPEHLCIGYLTAIWTVGIVGAAGKLFAFDFVERFSVLYYVAMGCMGLGVIFFMIDFMPSDVLVFIVLGGFSYLIGVLFYIWHSLTFHHVIWHLFVLGGSFFHFISVFKSLGV